MKKYLEKSKIPLLSEILPRLLCGTRDVEYVGNPGNAGDAVIATGTRAVFSKLGLNITAGADTILVAGGGNLIPHYSNMRERLKKIPRSGKRIIILPSTAAWCFDLLKEFKDLILIARERETFQRAAKDGIRVILAHDAAFDIDYAKWSDIEPRSKVLRAFRTDCESVGHPAPEANRDISEIHGNQLWSFTEAEKAAEKFIEDIAQYEEVFTDRLHVAIVAAMLGRKAVVYPGNYHKNRTMFDASLCEFPNATFINDIVKKSETPEIRSTVSRFDRGEWIKSFDSFAGTPPDDSKIRGDKTLFDPWPRGHFLPIVPESGTLILDGGCTHDKNGWTLTKDGEMVVDLSWFPSPEEVLLHCRSYPPIKHWKRIRGSCLDLSTNWCADNYAHFFLESLGRLAVAKASGIDPDDYDYIRLPLPRSHQVPEMLRRFGIDRAKLIAPENDFTLMQFDRLVRPSLPGVSKQYHPELAKFLNQCVAIEPEGPEKVFLRRTARQRLAKNGAKAEEALKARGFTIIDPSWAPLGSWSASRVVIGAHQAGLADLVICEKGAKVLELLPSDHQAQYYPNLSAQAGHDYYCLMCPSESNRSRGTRNVSPFNFDIPIDPLMDWVDEIKA